MRQGPAAGPLKLFLFFLFFLFFRQGPEVLIQTQA